MSFPLWSKQKTGKSCEGKLYLSCLCNDWLTVCGFILFYLCLSSRVKVPDKNCNKVPQLYDLKWMSHFHIQTRSQLSTCGKATQWYTVPWRKCHPSSSHCDAGHVSRLDDDDAYCRVNIQGAPSSVKGRLIPLINVWSETAFNLWEICLSKNLTSSLWPTFFSMPLHFWKVGITHSPWYSVVLPRFFLLTSCLQMAHQYPGWKWHFVFLWIFLFLFSWITMCIMFCVLSTFQPLAQKEPNGSE